MGLCHGNARSSIRSLDKLIVRCRKEIAEDLSVVLCIFDHENAFAHAAAIPSLILIGIVTLKVDPDPGTDTMPIVPPCISTIRLEIARPRPVPPFLRVLLSSTCWNSSKIRA